jgi:hypothetical protein
MRMSENESQRGFDVFVVVVTPIVDRVQRDHGMMLYGYFLTPDAV